MNKVAAIIPNFNMHERAIDLVKYLHRLRDAEGCNLEVILVDNGSKEEKFVNVLRLPKNVQTTGAWLMGLNYADALEYMYGEKFFAYMFLITSAEFTSESKNVINPMLEILEKNENVVGVHPALTDDSTTSWEHLKARGVGFRSVWMIDNICSMWRADWFNSIGRFDPRLLYAWGSDLETCYKARKQNRGLYVCDDVKIKKVTDIGYDMGRMGMSAGERKELARKNMDEVFKDKYGDDWKDLLYNEY